MQFSLEFLWCDLCLLFFLSTQLKMIQTSQGLIIWATGKFWACDIWIQNCLFTYFFSEMTLLLSLQADSQWTQSQSNQLNIYSSGSYKSRSASFSVQTNSLMAHKQSFDNSGICMHTPCNIFISQIIFYKKTYNLFYRKYEVMQYSEC